MGAVDRDIPSAHFRRAKRDAAAYANRSTTGWPLPSWVT